MGQGQHGLDEASRSGRRIEMAEIALDGAQGDAVRRNSGEGQIERRHLDGIAQRRGGAVALHIADRRSIDAGISQRRDDRRGLPVHRWRRERGLVRAVVGDADAADHRMDGVAVADGVIQALEHDDAHPGAADGAVCVRIIGTANAGARGDAAFGMDIADRRKHAQRRRTSQGRAAASQAQRVDGRGDRRQSGRAGAAHRGRRSGQAQLVGQSRRGEILVGADDHRIAVGTAGISGPVAQIVQQVGIEADTDEGTDRAVAARVAGSILQGVPRGLEKEPLLRIDLRRLAAAIAERLRVKQGRAVERRRHRDEIRVVQQVGGDACRGQFRHRESPRGDNAVPQIVPQGIAVGGSGKAEGHPDHGDLSTDRRCYGAGDRAGHTRAADVTGQGGNGGKAEQVDRAQRRSGGLGDAHQGLGDQQGMRAHLEQVGLHVDRLLAQQICPYPGDGVLQSGAGGQGGRGWRGWQRQAGPVDLAGRQGGQGWQEYHPQRDSGGRQPFGQPSAQRLGFRRSHRPGDHRRATRRLPP